jgi:hypothetical protein
VGPESVQKQGQTDVVCYFFQALIARVIIAHRCLLSALKRVNNEVFGRQALNLHPP